jgi:DNA-binding SARP family transcriptional activator
MNELRIRLLGAFGVSVGAREIASDEWRLRKARAIVKLLALTPGHRVHREQLFDQLWPELDPDAAANQLRKAVHEIRRVLDPDPSATYRYLESGEQLRLCTSVRVDVADFEAAALDARRSRDPDGYAIAIARYNGDLLPEDRYEDWAISYAEPLRAEFLSLLVERAQLLEARGDFDAAAADLHRVVAIDAVHEDAARALMRVYALAGRRHESLLAYERLSQSLGRELGAEPDPTTHRLYEQIRTGRAFEPELGVDLWEQVGDLRVLSGDSVGAAAAYRSALGVLISTDDAPRAAMLNRKAAQAQLMMHAADAAERHILAAQALLATSADDAESGRLLGVRANWLCETGRYLDAQDAAEASLAAVKRFGTPDDVAAAHDTLAIVCHFRGAWREGLHIQIARMAAAEGDDVRLANISDIHCCIGQYHLYGDGLCDNVEQYARETLDLAIDKGARRAEAFAWCLLGEALLLQARWDEAAGCLERSTEVYGELDARSGVLPWQRLAELAVGKGDSDSAAVYLRRGMAIATVTPLAAHAWGRLYATAAFDAVERGEPAEAVRAVRSAMRATARYGECPSCAALLNPVAAEAFAALGDRASATEHAQAAEQVAQSFQSSAWTAMAQNALGSVALACDDTPTARERFLRAAELYEQARQPFWSARSRFQAARTGAGGAADRELLSEVADEFERLGALRSGTAARRILSER